MKLQPAARPTCQHTLRAFHTQFRLKKTRFHSPAVISQFAKYLVTTMRDILTSCELHQGNVSCTFFEMFRPKPAAGLAQDAANPMEYS